MKKVTFISSIIICCILQSTYAAIININLIGNDGSLESAPLDGTTYISTAAPLTYTGTRWNDLPSLVLNPNGNLTVDSTGNSISLTYQSTGFVIEDVDFARPLPITNGTLVGSNNGSFTIGGFSSGELVPSIAFVSSTSDSIGATITIGATTLTVNNPNPSAGSFVEGENLLTFTNITADAAGNITATFTDESSSSLFALSGLQIQTVPEPSSTSLIAAGLTALFLRRKRTTTIKQ